MALPEGLTGSAKWMVTVVGAVLTVALAAGTELTYFACAGCAKAGGAASAAASAASRPSAGMMRAIRFWLKKSIGGWCPPLLRGAWREQSCGSRGGIIAYRG